METVTVRTAIGALGVGVDEIKPNYDADWKFCKKRTVNEQLVDTLRGSRTPTPSPLSIKTADPLKSVETPPSVHREKKGRLRA